GVHPSDIGAKLHVGSLDIQPAGCLNPRGTFTLFAIQPTRNEESALMTRHREISKMFPPSPSDRIVLEPAWDRVARLEHAVETNKRSRTVAGYSERLRQMLPPGSERGRLAWWFVALDDLRDRSCIL